jgi:Fe-S oxidoreductase
LLKDVVSSDAPLVGIEPSAILSFRDEYPDLVGKDLKVEAMALAQNTFLYDEFIMREVDAGRISSESFTDKSLNIKLHGHCHQKAIVTTEFSRKMLSLPVNYKVEVLSTGCCGMAGSFGYEKEHYDLSMRIGEQSLFPAVRSAGDDEVIAAPGFSCRQQIKDGTGKTAFHPVEILLRALKSWNIYCKK